MIYMFHERTFHKSISRATWRVTDSYLRLIYLVTAAMARSSGPDETVDVTRTG